MIFVSTGSTKQSSFYLPLIQKLEQLKKEKTIDDDIVIQSGHIQYQSPYFKEIFGFTSDFERYINQADVVVTADGAGVIFELLTRKKRIVVVPNKLASLYGAPVDDFVGGFENEGYLVWCKNINDIHNCIQIARNKKFRTYKSPSNNIAHRIIGEYNLWKQV